MEASKVEVTAETLRNNKLSRKRKRQLRRRAAMELIEARGLKPIPIEDFMRVMNIRHPGQAYGMLKQMCDEGKIERHARGEYSVIRPVKTVKPARFEHQLSEIFKRLDALEVDYSLTIHSNKGGSNAKTDHTAR